MSEDELVALRRAVADLSGRLGELLRQAADALRDVGKKRPQEPVCACTFDDQATQLGPGFTSPVCAVHPPEEST